MAAERLQPPAAELDAGRRRGAARRAARSIAFAELRRRRAVRRQDEPKAPLKNPSRYTVVGQSLPRPDMPGQGHRPPRLRARLQAARHAARPRDAAAARWAPSVLAVDEASVRRIPGVRVVRIADFLGVVAADEWAAVRAARELKVRWSDGAALIGHARVIDWARPARSSPTRRIVAKGDAARDRPRSPTRADALRAHATRWPMQSHGSMGPSCAVADVRADGGTVWTASQAHASLPQRLRARSSACRATSCA